MIASRRIVACVLGLGVVMTGPAEARRAKCPTEGKRVVAVSTEASVFRRDGGPNFYGCDRRTRRVVTLNVVDDGNGGYGKSESARPPILHGRFEVLSVVISD